MPLIRAFAWWAILGSNPIRPPHETPVSPTKCLITACHLTPRHAASNVVSGTERAINEGIGTMTTTIAATVSAACDHDQHHQCHDHTCVCGCHVLFPLIGK